MICVGMTVSGLKGRKMFSNIKECLRILQGARKALEPGFIQKVGIQYFEDLKIYRVCSVYALNHSVRAMSVSLAHSTRFFEDRLEEKYKTRDVVGWNDDPRRTHKEVMEMFDYAIAELDKQMEIEVAE